MEQRDRDQIARMIEERLREYAHTGEQNLGLAAKVAELESNVRVAWQAFIDLRGVMENGFTGINKRLDTTNGNINDLHTWRDRSIGAIAVLSLIITTFGATAIVLAMG